LLVYLVAKRWNANLSVDSLLTLMIASILGVVLGGRLGYVLFYNLEHCLAHPLEILMFTKGGMSFHGGLLGMVIAMIIAVRLIKIPLLRLGDLVVIAAPVGIFFVRIANFINGELWGAPTDLPWGVVFDDKAAGFVARHPTQLYEAFLEGLVLFVILFALARRTPPRKEGFYIGVFMLGYGVFRILVEFVREPDSHIGYLFNSGWITMGMLLSLPMVVAGLIFLMRTPRKASGAQMSAAHTPARAYERSAAVQAPAMKAKAEVDKKTARQESAQTELSFDELLDTPSTQKPTSKDSDDLS
jgi:phosphatidylglycerol:prolipoprotein diacylglycerol transferase